MSELSINNNKETHSLAMPSLIFSIFSILFAGGLIWPILGLLFSIAALKNFKENPERYHSGGRSLANIARVCSIIGLVLTILVWIAIITFYFLYFAGLMMLIGMDL